MQVYSSTPILLTPGYSQEERLVQDLNTQLLTYAESRQNSDFVYSQMESRGFVSYRLILSAKKVGFNADESPSRCLLIISDEMAKLKEYIVTTVHQATGITTSVSVFSTLPKLGNSNFQAAWNEIGRNAQLFSQNLELYGQ